MKELSIEQKAKLYDDAKARMSRAFNTNRFTIGFMNEIFPELRVSNDEKIRIAILELVKQSSEILDKQNQKDMMAWLEKQNPSWSEKDKNILNRLIGVLDGINEEDYHEGWEDKFLPWLKSIKERTQPQPKQCEQPTNKIEPKFKIGDWVILNGTVAQILDKQKYGFVGLDIDGKDFFCNYGHTNSMRLWTIADAKDGDVLVDSYSKDSIIILYKGIDKERSILAYCGWNGYILFVTSNDRLGYGELDNTNYLPATKEQCDLLFQKIKEADYEWNSEKKELKKIKVASKESENERIKKEIIDFFELPHPQFVGKRDQEEWLAWIKKQGEQKQTWKPTTAQLIVIKDLIEDKNTSKVNKVVLRGMFDEFKQCFRL